MPKTNKRNSAYMKSPRAQASLDNWVGPMQHAPCISTDPVHEEIPKGPLKSRQYVKKEQRG